MVNDFAKLQRTPREVSKWQKAQQHIVNGRPGQAVPVYQELVKRFPGAEQLWFELGLAGTGDLEFKLASEAFQRAQQLAPQDVSLQVLLGQQFHRLRRPELARAAFEQAAKANPDSIHARLSLAAWYERERRLEDAWTSMEASLAGHPNHPQVLCVKAQLLHRLKRDSEAEVLLRDLVRSEGSDLNVKISSRHLLGTVLDQLGQYSEALHWLCESKEILKRTANVARMQSDYDRADRERRELLSALTAQILQRWKAERTVPGLTNPLVLLGGHPRSGTTLLEQILGAHPSVVAFDESEAFALEIWQTLAPMGTGHKLTLGGLDTLAAAQRSRIRERYLKSLLRETDEPLNGRVLVDKNPSPTAALHLGLRIFPEFKALIALRDPRDVIISCFFQNLMLTPANANFLSLERTVKHYGDLMDVWLRLRELGGFEWMESRYEDLVAQPETEGRRVTEFCGLQWDINQGNHQEVARKKVLFAPTFSDVAQPIHQRAVGRWQHYAEALAPQQPKLEKYCRAFGYGSG